MTSKPSTGTINESEYSATISETKYNKTGKQSKYHLRNVFLYLVYGENDNDIYA